MTGKYWREKAISRRDALAWGGAAASVLVMNNSMAVAGPMMPGDFRVASSRLCGIALDASYGEMAEAVWAAVIAELGEERPRKVCDLAARLADGTQLKAALKKDGLEPVARTIIYTWYNGWINQGGQIDAVKEPRRIAMQTADDQALMWRTCQDWTKAPGDCGGPFGYWQAAPGQGATP